MKSNYFTVLALLCSRYRQENCFLLQNLAVFGKTIFPSRVTIDFSVFSKLSLKEKHNCNANILKITDNVSSTTQLIKQFLSMLEKIKIHFDWCFKIRFF